MAKKSEEVCVYIEFDQYMNVASELNMYTYAQNFPTRVDNMKKKECLIS